MIRVTCTRVFVDPREVGTFWDFPDIASAERECGVYFMDNHCEVKEITAPREGFNPCRQAGCSYCDPD